MATVDELQAARFVSRDRLPAFGFHAYWDTKLRSLPNIFQIINGIVCVSGRLADLLREFNLGRTQLIEFPIYQHDRETPVEPKDGGIWHILNIAEHKDCFVPEATTEKLYGGPLRGSYSPGFWGLGEIAVRPSAAEGVDLWMDPMLHNTPFFSDRLAQAIRKGKFGRHGLKRCRVIALH